MAEPGTIELYDEKGKLAIACKVHRCWVSEYQRDTSVAAPTEEAHQG